MTIILARSTLQSLDTVQNDFRISKERGEKISLNQKREPLRHEFLSQNISNISDNSMNLRRQLRCHSHRPSLQPLVWTTWLYPFSAVRGLLNDLFCRSSGAKVSAQGICQICTKLNPCVFFQSKSNIRLLDQLRWLCTKSVVIVQRTSLVSWNYLTVLIVNSPKVFFTSRLQIK